MVEEDDALEKNRQWFREWYSDNREAYNKLRRERYKRNKEQQKKARDRAEQRRRLGIKSVSDPIEKEVNGDLITCYPISYIADQLNKDPQAVRNWETRGIIPKPTIPGAHRFYTEKQFGFLLMLGEILEIKPYELRKEPYAKLQKLITEDWDNHGS